MKSAFVAAALLTLPGQWISLSLPHRSQSFMTRLALGVALTPLCTALGTMALLSLGLSFEQVATHMEIAALGGGAWVILAASRSLRRPSAESCLLGGCAAAVSIACVAIPWVAWPSFRELSWHGLMHTDIIYAIVRAGGRPEDPNTAGLPLQYHWVSHVHLAVAAWASDWSPTRVYLVSNLASLLASATLSVALARALGMVRPKALFALVLLLLSTNLIGVVARAATFLGARADGSRILGDIRYSPFVTKFVTFNTMPLALTLLLAASWIVVASARSRLASAPELYGLVLLAIAMLYPPLLPVGGLLFPGLYVVLRAVKGGARRARVRLCLSTAVAVVAGYVWVRSITGDAGAGGFVELASIGGALKHLRNLVVALGPLLLLAAPRIRAVLRERDAAYIALLFMGLGSAAGYMLVHLPDGIEYKFVFGTTLAMYPLAAEGLWLWRHRLIRQETRAWAVSAAVGTLLTAAWVLSVGRTQPPMGKDTPQVVSSHFYINLGPGNRYREWTMAVRQNTPTDAILVEPESGIKSTVFTNRSSYLARAPRGTDVAGFNFSYETYFEDRGLPRHDLETRAALLDELYSSDDPGVLEADLRTLRALGRPLVLRLDRGQHGGLSRFLTEAVGEPMYLDPAVGVWLIPRARAI